jgi:mono/diheme cytochrome c family protein
MKLFALIYLLTIGGLTMVLFQEKTKKESIEAGQEIYQDFCVQCHLNSGEGVSGVFPPLKASDYLMNNVEKSVAELNTGYKAKSLSMMKFTMELWFLRVWITRRSQM